MTKQTVTTKLKQLSLFNQVCSQPVVLSSGSTLDHSGLHVHKKTVSMATLSKWIWHTSDRSQVHLKSYKITIPIRPTTLTVALQLLTKVNFCHMVNTVSVSTFFGSLSSVCVS